MEPTRVNTIVNWCNQLCVGLKIESKDLEIKTFADGIASKIYHVIFKVQTDDSLPNSVVVKFGKTPWSVFEKQNLKSRTTAMILGPRQMGPRVLLITDLAVIFEFLPNLMLMGLTNQSRPLSDVDDQNETMFRMLAQKVAELHSMEVPIARNDFDANAMMTLCDGWVPKDWYDSQINTDWVQEAMKRNGCDTLLNNYLPEIMDFVRQCLTSQIDATWPVVFSHGDLNHPNVRIVNSTNSIQFLDFDDSCYTFRGYDLGRYFSEWGTSQLFVYHKLISESKMRQFIKYYIEENCRIYGQSYRDDPNNSPDKILKESKLFILYAYLFNATYTFQRGLNNKTDLDEYLVHAETNVKMLIEYQKMYEKEIQLKKE